MIEIVGDRPDDLLGALRYMAASGMSLIVASGGLGPTADDLTAEVVGRFQGRELVLDEELEARIAEILRPLMARRHDLDADAIRESNRKQAVIPAGATVLNPVGTAPGLVVPPPDGDSGPTVVVLPGPPGELQRMWKAAVATEAFQSAIAGAPEYRREIVRLFGIPESEIANTLRAASEAGLDLSRLEITTCLRRGEIEVSTRYEPSAQRDYDRFLAFLRKRHADTLFSEDGSTVDDQVIALLGDRTIAVAESCTGGLMSARLTERGGSSAWMLGGVVAYSNSAKVSLAGVDASLIERFGAVSVEVAEALADGARERFGASVGVGITGIAGPDGGTDAKPVGTVCFSVVGPSTERTTRSLRLPGSRSDVRERSTTVAMHLIRRSLLDGGASAPSEAGSAEASRVT
jgi:nicotinamide-nucleotide amidase